MSIQAVAWVLENSESKGTARLVLIALANRANPDHDWECWPAMRGLAHEAGVASPSTVKDALERLEELGEVEIISHGDARHSGRYRMTFMGERSGGEHSGVPEPNAASSPDTTQRSVQTEQNRKEPKGTEEREPPKKKALIPQDWLPSERTREWCRDEWPQYAHMGTVEHFRDHHRHKGTLGRDWEAAFRNWVRNAPNFERQSREPTRTHLGQA